MNGIKEMLLYEREKLINWQNRHVDNDAGILYIELQIKFIDRLLKRIEAEEWVKEQNNE